MMYSTVTAWGLREVARNTTPRSSASGEGNGSEQYKSASRFFSAKEKSVRNDRRAARKPFRRDISSSNSALVPILAPSR